MANRSKDRRGRSRKRRPAGPARSTAAATDAVPRLDAAGSSKSAPRAARGSDARRPRSSPTAPRYGERPRAPWHPLPLSELLILIGALVTVLGVHRLDPKNPEFSKGGPTLIAGIAAVAIGTVEVTLREHRSGYRSHTVMLSAIPVLIFDTAVVLVVSAFTTAPRLLSVGLLAVDIILFAFLFRILRARFLDARHARVLREG